MTKIQQPQPQKGKYVIRSKSKEDDNEYTYVSGVSKSGIVYCTSNLKRWLHLCAFQNYKQAFDYYNANSKYLQDYTLWPLSKTIIKKKPVEKPKRKVSYSAKSKNN